jgi:hypothetical protein
MERRTDAERREVPNHRYRRWLMPFAVFDTGNPANDISFPSLKGGGWETHVFPTFDEAVKYARSWLGSMDMLVDVNVWKTCPVKAIYAVTNFIEIVEIGVKVPAPKDYGDQCPCGINPKSCDYHRGSNP